MARTIAAPKVLVAEVRFAAGLKPTPIRVHRQALCHHTASRTFNRFPALSTAIPSIRRRSRAALLITVVASTTATSSAPRKRQIAVMIRQALNKRGTAK